MDSEQQKVFEKILKQDPYDEVTHKVYADWLLENDQPELSEIHRMWTKEWQEAKEWLEDFAKKGGRHSLNYDEGYMEDEDGNILRDEDYNPLYEPSYVEKIVPITIDLLIEAAHNWVKSIKLSCWKTPSGEIRYSTEAEYFIQQGSDSLRSLIYDETVLKKFWECYQIYTRTEVPKEKQGRLFSCSC